MYITAKQHILYIIYIYTRLRCVYCYIVYRYIKVNYPPYLFEVHLFAPVVEERCTAKVGNGAITFHLVKQEPGCWHQLCSDESEEKSVMAEKRAEAVEHARKSAEASAEAKAKKKREEEQFAIREQMRLEEEERGRIESEKREEREKAEKELELWKQRKREAAKAKAAPTREAPSVQRPTPVLRTGSIWNDTKKKPPPPRAKGSIQVRFTPRAFPTAARESKEAEETEWLAKMAAARKINLPEGKSDEGINERNPEFLKDKGVEFFKVGNYKAALNAFSEAIKLNPDLPQLFSNRAACYLAIGENERCINDCCRSLELFFPVVPSNYTSRTKVFVRRGTAYANVGMMDLAVQDYEAAVKLSPHDSKLKEDCRRLQEAAM